MTFEQFKIAAANDLAEKLASIAEDIRKHPERYEGMDEDEWFDTLLVVEVS